MVSKNLEQTAETAESEEITPPGYVRCTANYHRCNKIIREKDAFYQGQVAYCPDCKDRWDNEQD